MQPARVLIVDDHALFRQGVHDALEREEGLSVVGEAEDGHEALSKAMVLRPDIILLDINMPSYGGEDAVWALKRALPETKVIMLTVHDDDEHLLEAIRGGADGFLTKKLRVEGLVRSLRGVMRGEAALSRAKMPTILKEYTRLARMEANDVAKPLTPREWDVLVEIERGATNREIADTLVVSEYTVKAHVTSILRKLHLSSRYEAAAYARRVRFRDGMDVTARS